MHLIYFMPIIFCINIIIRTRKKKEVIYIHNFSENIKLQGTPNIQQQQLKSLILNAKCMQVMYTVFFNSSLLYIFFVFI